MRACNNDYSALDLLESRIGRTAYDVSGQGLEINCMTVGNLAKEAGEAISTLAGAIEDQKIDHEEKKRCTRELLDLQTIVNRLLGQLNQ